jgi:membrane associated rhomboid family serine protease
VDPTRLPIPGLDGVGIYLSNGRAACDERAFVLHAVGIASQVLFSGRDWILSVDATDAALAAAHLIRYERENPPRRRFIQPEGTHPWAWLAAAAYALVMLAVAWLAGQKALASNWMNAGVVDTAAVRAGEWWRAVTALTLHFDVGHLVANLGFGTVFLWLAAQLLGPGVAVAAVLAAASAANLLNTLVQPADHISAGASTAVFATLGLLSAYAWRRREAEGGRWSYRWAPLVAGVFLLGFTGAGGERTDVLAHLTGFLTGAVAGALFAMRRQPMGAPAQWLSAIGAAATVVAAWACALGSGLAGH